MIGRLFLFGCPLLVVFLCDMLIMCVLVRLLVGVFACAFVCVDCFGGLIVCLFVFVRLRVMCLCLCVLVCLFMCLIGWFACWLVGCLFACLFT